MLWCIMYFHTSIIDLGQTLGYYSINDIGTCCGFTLRWIEACLLGEEAIFNRRIERILTAIKDPDLLKKINTVKEKMAVGEVLTTEDNEWLDLFAFYGSMALYQEPSRYPQIFNALYSQYDIDHVSKLAGSEKILKLGGLSTIYSEFGIYTQVEIQDLLEQFSTALTRSNYSRDAWVGFILTNQNHAVGVMYQRDSNLWKFKDINTDVLTEEILTTEQLSNAIFLGFKGRLSVEEVEAILFRLEEENNALSSASEIQEKFCFSLEAEIGKTIDIVYHAKSGMWAFETDVDNTNSSLMNREEFSQQIVSQNSTNSLNPYVTFSTSVITSLHHEEQFHLGQQLKKHKQVQQLPEEMVHREEAANLACVVTGMNNIVMMRKLIKLGIDLDKAKNYAGFRPIHIAAGYGFIPLIKLFLKQEIDINTLADDGRTPVYAAASYDAPNSIAILFKHGANLDIPQSDGETPVYISAAKGHVRAIKVLAKYGANLNLAQKNGQTPAFVAAQNGHVAVISEFAKHGVNFDAATLEGGTPAFIAAQEGHELVIAELAKHGANLEQGLISGFSPIHVAVQNGHIDVVYELAKRGANLNAQTSSGDTPVACAVDNGQIKMISVLAQYGANLNLPDNDGKTPVFLAAEEGDVAMIIELTKYGADLNQGLGNGTAPIHVAAQNGHVEVVEELLKQGVNPNISMKNGVTASYIAAQHGDQKMLSLLASRGADITIKCNGRTPLFIAAQQGHVETVRFLLNNTELHSVPCFASTSTWQSIAKRYGEEAEKHMNHFIKLKLKDEGNAEIIDIFPEDIARILGHEETITVFTEFASRRKSTSLYKEEVNALKGQVGSRDDSIRSGPK